MKHTFIPYNPKLKTRARELRKNGTPAEVKLWGCLKKRQIADFDFDRQKPLDEYIVDFYCKELMLAIEIDGASHQNKEAYDKHRQKCLESFGVHFLRFQEREVVGNLEGVVAVIKNWIAERSAG